MHVPRATLAIYFHKEIKLDSLIALSVIMVGIYIGPSPSGGDGFEGTNPMMRTSCRHPAKPGVLGRTPCQEGQCPANLLCLASGNPMGTPGRQDGHQAGRMRLPTAGTTSVSVGKTQWYSVLGDKLLGREEGHIFSRKLTFQALLT